MELEEATYCGQTGTPGERVKKKNAKISNKNNAQFYDLIKKKDIFT